MNRGAPRPLRRELLQPRARRRRQQRRLRARQLDAPHDPRAARRRPLVEGDPPLRHEARRTARRQPRTSRTRSRRRPAGTSTGCSRSTATSAAIRSSRSRRAYDVDKKEVVLQRQADAGHHQHGAGLRLPGADRGRLQGRTRRRTRCGCGRRSRRSACPRRARRRWSPSIRATAMLKEVDFKKSAAELAFIAQGGDPDVVARLTAVEQLSDVAEVDRDLARKTLRRRARRQGPSRPPCGRGRRASASSAAPAPGAALTAGVKDRRVTRPARERRVGSVASRRSSATRRTAVAQALADAAAQRPLVRRAAGGVRRARQDRRATAGNGTAAGRGGRRAARGHRLPVAQRPRRQRGDPRAPRAERTAWRSTRCSRWSRAAAAAKRRSLGLASIGGLSDAQLGGRRDEAIALLIDAAQREGDGVALGDQGARRAQGRRGRGDAEEDRRTAERVARSHLRRAQLAAPDRRGEEEAAADLADAAAAEAGPDPEGAREDGRRAAEADRRAADRARRDEAGGARPPAPKTTPTAPPASTTPPGPAPSGAPPAVTAAGGGR